MQGESSTSDDETDPSQTPLASRFVVKNDIRALRRWLNERKLHPESMLDAITRDKRGWSPIDEAACRIDRQKCFELLLEYVDVCIMHHNVPNDWLESALYVACEANCEENVIMLLRRGTNPSTITLSALSTLQIAVVNGHTTIVKHLLRYNAFINDQTVEGRTSLHLAVLDGNLEIAEVLVEHGIDLTLPDNAGNLALHEASQKDSADFIELILDGNPCIINVKNKDSLTALQMAIGAAKMDCIRCLLNRGAQTSSREFECIPTDADNAVKVEIVKLLLDYFKGDKMLKLCNAYINTQEKSITCDIIDLHSVECLSLLLKSDLPRFFLKAPYASHGIHYRPPLVHLINRSDMCDSVTRPMIRLLLDHDIIFSDDYFRVLKSKGPEFSPDFLFESFCTDRLRLYYEILSEKDVTVDYALQCYCNNADEILTVDDVNEFTFMHMYYLPHMSDEFDIDTQTLKFLISNSSVLEPGLLAVNLFKLQFSLWFGTAKMRSHFIYSFLTDMVPMYHLRSRCIGEVQEYLDEEFELTVDAEEVVSVWEEFSPVAVEFAKSTLKQLCRTVIRKSFRGENIRDDFLNFRRKINELSLPTVMKNYLMYRD